MKFSRVHPWEWFAGLIGLITLVGLVTGASSPGVLHAIVILVAAAGAIVPVIVAMSEKTNVPIVFETLLWIVTLLVGLILIVRALIPSDTVFESGWLALAGTLVMSFALWRSMAREY
ncbi:MAG: hypothetical protein KDB52_02520 [Solirubrobacterales bacterium]|nr:hypothetical protein [Solirubrobacterales bacterium]